MGANVGGATDVGGPADAGGGGGGDGLSSRPDP